MAGTTDDALHAQVKSIVDELEAAASGSLYKVDGEYEIIEDLDEWKREQYEREAEEFKETHSEDDIDEPDEVSLGEYIDDRSLGDVRVEISLSDRSLVGGKVLFCYGGPNIWVADDEVRGYWGGSRCEMALDSETRSALFSWFEEMWGMSGGR